MPVLNDADDVKLGDQQVEAIYAGTELVWANSAANGSYFTFQEGSNYYQWDWNGRRYIANKYMGTNVQSATYTFVDGGNGPLSDVNVTLIGGGGAGATYTITTHGGAGSGGEVKKITGLTVGHNLSVFGGQGGTVTASGSVGNKGATITLTEIGGDNRQWTAKGGIGGSPYPPAATSDETRWGGSAVGAQSSGAATGGQPFTGQGFKGGDGFSSSTPTVRSSGGGAGAGGPGGNAASEAGGKSGPGAVIFDGFPKISPLRAGAGGGGKQGTSNSYIPYLTADDGGQPHWGPGHYFTGGGGGTNSVGGHGFSMIDFPINDDVPPLELSDMAHWAVILWAEDPVNETVPADGGIVTTWGNPGHISPTIAPDQKWLIAFTEGAGPTYHSSVEALSGRPSIGFNVDGRTDDQALTFFHNGFQQNNNQTLVAVFWMVGETAGQSFPTIMSASGTTSPWFAKNNVNGEWSGFSSGTPSLISDKKLDYQPHVLVVGFDTSGYQYVDIDGVEVTKTAGAVTVGSQGVLVGKASSPNNSRFTGYIPFLAVTVEADQESVRWSATERQAIAKNLMQHYGIPDPTIPPPTRTTNYFTGGIEYTVGGYRYHRFNTSGDLTFVDVEGNGSPVEFEYAVVAGGGAGATCNNTPGYFGGGGGAGGVLTGTTQTSQSQVVTIGAGGAIGANGANGNNGNDSSIGSLAVAEGGGGGGGEATTGGSPGGSGGAGSNTPAGARPAGVGTPGQGFDGAIGRQSAGAGGGGASAVGKQATSTYTPGGGGDGVAVPLLFGVPVGGGGGGGGDFVYINYDVGPGGKGGGGAGGYSGAQSYQTANAQPGSTNTGGGGGGGGRGGSASHFLCYGAAGGSGVVVVRYPWEQ